MATAKKSSDVNIEEVTQRLRDSGVAAAARAGANLTSGLGVLHHQLKRPKTTKWQGESAWILDGLRYTAIDGLDIQKSMGYSDEGTHSSDSLYVCKASRQAKQALLSSASPLGAAQALSKNLDPLIAKCSEIADNLQQLIETEQNIDKDATVDRNRARATPTDSSAPSKKGI